MGETANTSTRRQLLAAAGLAAPAVVGLSGCATAEAPAAAAKPAAGLPDSEVFSTPADLIVDTDKGKVRGYVSGGIRTFKGIPYGADTSGKNRFRPPVAPEPCCVALTFEDAVRFSGERDVHDNPIPSISIGDDGRGIVD